MTARRACQSAACVFSLASGLVGCALHPTDGYSSQSLFARDIATIAVPIFENSTFDREVGLELTDSLIKEIQARTPYQIADQSRADTVILGRIRAVELDQLSKSRNTGLTEEAILSVSIDFEWKNLRTGQSLVKRESFAGNGLFVPSRPTGESIELGRFAVVQQLARDVVDELHAPW